ncbi:hypothetical protein A0H76_1881 [Hepatospora eriocheir]|uniref:C2H2-type domain-containing protein n=1 Tax=Hepatospora eriocheir TaxID=1081669 RepID=A0A1X0QDP4_9MICR|nr:hypothetical protein HERIO_347 [Hepatospora eriocheir]ORE00239.1 hypothetical protein A0H76_1881 [Hepatospora eriocheir]
MGEFSENSDDKNLYTEEKVETVTKPIPVPGGSLYFKSKGKRKRTNKNQDVVFTDYVPEIEYHNKRFTEKEYNDALLFLYFTKNVKNAKPEKGENIKTVDGITFMIENNRNTCIYCGKSYIHLKKLAVHMIKLHNFKK